MIGFQSSKSCVWGVGLRELIQVHPIGFMHHGDSYMGSSLHEGPFVGPYIIRDPSKKGPPKGPESRELPIYCLRYSPECLEFLHSRP